MNDLFYSHSLGLTVFELTCDRAVGALWKQHQRSGKHVDVLIKIPNVNLIQNPSGPTKYQRISTFPI